MIPILDNWHPRGPLIDVYGSKFAYDITSTSLHAKIYIIIFFRKDRNAQLKINW